MIKVKEEICPVCANRIEDCICCPECGDICVVSEEGLLCPACGLIKPPPEGE